MYNIKTNEDVMKEWHRRYPNIPLIEDGVVSPSRYWQEKTKIVICLKEVVTYEDDSNPLIGIMNTIPEDGRFDRPEDSYSITNYLYETGGSYNTPAWSNECRIAELLLTGKATHKFDEEDGTIHRREIFRRIAHIELSKLGGTRYESEWYQKVINDNKDLIGKQLSNFDANYYIICGKTSWDVVKSVINLERYKHLELNLGKGNNMEFWAYPEENKTLILMNHLSDVYRFEKQFEVLKTWVNS